MENAISFIQENLTKIHPQGFSRGWIAAAAFNG